MGGGRGMSIRYAPRGLRGLGPSPLRNLTPGPGGGVRRSRPARGGPARFSRRLSCGSEESGGISVPIPRRDRPRTLSSLTGPPPRPRPTGAPPRPGRAIPAHRLTSHTTTPTRAGETEALEGGDHKCIQASFAPWITQHLSEIESVSQDAHVQAQQPMRRKMAEEAEMRPQRRSLASSKIRISVNYDGITNNAKLSDRQKTLVTDKLMPAAVEFIRDNVRVKNPVSGPLRLPRTCRAEWTGINVCRELRDIGYW